MKIQKELETDEPMPCQRNGCNEELNGLMRHWIDFGNGYIFEMWLCFDCSEFFKQKYGDNIETK